jgi:hypothetical protein
MPLQGGAPASPQNLSGQVESLITRQATSCVAAASLHPLPPPPLQAAEVLSMAGPRPRQEEGWAGGVDPAGWVPEPGFPPGLPRASLRPPACQHSPFAYRAEEQRRPRPLSWHWRCTAVPGRRPCRRTTGTSSAKHWPFVARRNLCSCRAPALIGIEEVHSWRTVHNIKLAPLQ